MNNVRNINQNSKIIFTLSLDNDEENEKEKIFNLSFRLLKSKSLKNLFFSIKISMKQYFNIQQLINYLTSCFDENSLILFDINGNYIKNFCQIDFVYFMIDIKK